MKTRNLVHIILATLIATLLISSPSISVQTGGAGYQNREQTSADLRLGTTIEVDTGRTTIKSVPYLWPQYNGVSNSFLKHSDTTGTLTWEPLSASSLNLDNAKVFIGSGAGQAAARTISGDFTINSSALAAISPGAVTTSEIADGSITTSKTASTLLLPVAKGGTGASSLLQYAVLYGSGESALNASANFIGQPGTSSVLINGTILSNGSVGTMPAAATGSGSRFLWLPYKSALRAGYLDADYPNWWNEETIGTGSIALRGTGLATGTNSFVIGGVASGESAISLIAGDASSRESIAIGWASADNYNATVIGFLAAADGERSFNIGGLQNTRAESSYAFGNKVSSNADHNMSIGRATVPGILHIFDSVDNVSPYSLWILTYSQYPTMMVGPAPDTDSSGYVSIGSTIEADKLNVTGDIRLASIEAPSPNTNDLYNVNGTLYWNGMSLTDAGSLPAYGTAGNLIVDDGNIWTSAPLSGAVTIEAGGLTTLNNDTVTENKILTSAVTNAKITDNSVTLASPNQKVSGTLPYGNGGTNNNGFAEGSVIWAGPTFLRQNNANLFWNRNDGGLGIRTNMTFGAELYLSGSGKASTLDASGGLAVTGSKYGAFASGIIDPAEGITSVNVNKLMVTAEAVSSGVYEISADPQIAAGSDGQVIMLTSSSDDYMIKLTDGNGLKLSGGVPFTLGKRDMLELIYVQEIPAWVELERSDN